MGSTNGLAVRVLRCATIAAVLSLTANRYPSSNASRDIGNDAEVFYYLSVGTSLSVGVQPNGSGVTLPTDDGYPNVLFSSIRPAFEAVGNRELRLVKLGCPGETLDTFANGGSCLYFEGSQLDAAVDFLADNIGNVHLVTIDMGANDFRNAGCIDTAVDAVVGMNYYNPYLSSWLEGEAGQELAVDAAQAVALLNGVLDTTYETAGMPVADVGLAFASDDFTTMVASAQPAPNDMLPLNVSNICEFTYMCDPEPRGPDIHANDA